MKHDDVEIRPLDLLDPTQHSAAVRWIEVHAQVQREIFGPTGSCWTLQEIQRFYRSPSTQRMALAAWVGGELVGAAEVKMPVTDNLGLATLWLSTLPSHRRCGVGTALLQQAQRIGAEHGRTTFLMVSEWAQGGKDLGAAFATTHGYAVAQTMVRSELTLAQANDLAFELPSGSESLDDYTIESVVDHLPEAWLADRAVLQQRMSTDAPSDDLAVEEEAWDVERLRAGDARTRDSGRRIVESVAQHVSSGRLVAFTRVSISAGEPTLAYQQDTLVLREHRGHALGRRVKAATARLLMDTLPEVTTVRTWNAASNEPMLGVNARLGYVADGYSRTWQRVLR